MEEENEYNTRFVQLVCSALKELGHKITNLELTKAMSGASAIIEIEDQWLLEFEQEIQKDEVELIPSDKVILLSLSGGKVGNEKPIGKLKLV